MIDRAELKWPSKGEKLFDTESNSYYSFSHVGWGDVDTQFFGYIKGYKESADHLVDVALASKSIAILDTYVYPIIFLYRQFVELSIKSIYLLYSEDDIGTKIQSIDKVSHDLKESWKKMLPILSNACSTDEEKDMIQVVGDYILQFHAFDQSSFTFRYPIDKKLNRTIKGEQRIDIGNLKERMDELSNFFGGIDGLLDQIKEWKAEEQQMYAEMMQEMMAEYADFDY